ERLAGGIEACELARYAEAFRELARELGRDAARRVGRALRQHDVAEVDRGAQLPGRRQILHHVSRDSHLLLPSWWRDLRVGLIAALERVGDEAASLHVLDEGAQIGCGGGPTFRRRHGL